MLSVFITPWTNPISIHLAISDAWTATTASNSARYGRSASAALGWWRAIAWSARRRSRLEVAGGRGVLEAPDPQVTAGDAGEHGAGQQRLALHRAPGRHHGQGSRRRDTQGVHRLADDVFAQHRPHRRQAVATAREGRGAGTLQVDVAQAPVVVDEFAE